MFVTGLVERISFIRWQLVGRAVPSGGFHENQGAIVGDEMLTKKRVWISPVVGDCPPETSAADFASRTVKSIDATFWMFVVGTIDAFFNAQPIADPTDLAKGYARLGHSVGARIHAKKDDPLRAVSESSQILAITTGGMTQWIIDVRDRLSEVDRIEPLGEYSSRSVQPVSLSHDSVAPLLDPIRDSLSRQVGAQLSRSVD